MELINDRVAVVREPPDKTSPGGIVIPDTAQEAAVANGIVAFVGPGKLLDSGERATMQVKPGDRVVFMPRAGMTIPSRDSRELKYKVIAEADAWAILDHGVDVPETSYHPPGS